MPEAAITSAPVVSSPTAPVPAAPTAPAGSDRSLIPPGASGAPQGNGTPPVIAETWYKGWIKEDGSLDPQRLSHLPEDLKGSQSVLARFRKADDFFKSFAHAQQLVSQKGLTPLREGATAEERADHMKRLAMVTGAPEKPEGYGIKNDNPEIQKQYDEFSKVFHKHGLSPEAVKELVAVNEALQKGQLEAYEEQQARDEDTRWQEQEKLLKREFGAFQTEKFASARSGARWMGIDPDSPMFKQNAQLIIAAAKVGEKIGEAKFVDGGSASSTESDPEKEMAELSSNPAHKYYDILRHPDKNARLFSEACEYQRKLGERIAAKRARPR